MDTPPIHVLLALDAQILGGEAKISTPTVTESSAGDEGSSAPPSAPPPGAPIKVRTAGGREAIVLERTPSGWFRVELDGNANDEGGARERKRIWRSALPDAPPPPPSADELQLRRELQQLVRENKRLKTTARGGNWTVTSTYYTGGNGTVASRQSRRSSRAPEHRRLRAVAAVPPSPVTE